MGITARTTTALLGTLFLTGCVLATSDGDATRMTALVARDERWVEVVPRWSCDARGCGTLRGEAAERATHYLQFARDGRVRRATPSISHVASYARPGEETFHCTSGRWSAHGDVLELDFEDGGARSLEILWSLDVRATARGGHPLDHEDWRVLSGALPATGIGDPCPRAYARGAR